MRWVGLFGLVVIASGCDDASSTGATGVGGASGSTTATGSSQSTTGSGSSGAGTSTTGSASSGTASSGSSSVSSTSSGMGGPCAEGTLAYKTDFGVDGAWPAPWAIAGGVETMQVTGGRARLVPLHSNYPLARMKIPLSVVNSESTFTVEFENVPVQGVGFYGRQNGGYLGQTTPNGAGYAIFTAGVTNPAGIGSWFEAPGNGEVMFHTSPFNLQSNVVYRVRVRIENDTAATTRLRGRVWADGTAEPAAWTEDHTDATRPELQNLAGGFAIDAWHNTSNGAFENVWIDDLVICQL